MNKRTMAKSAMMLVRAKPWWSFLASRNCSLFTPCRRLPHFSIRNWKLPCFIIDNYISKPQVNLTEKLGRNNKKLIFHRHFPCFELVILRHAQSLILPKHIRLLALVMFHYLVGWGWRHSPVLNDPRAPGGRYHINIDSTHSTSNIYIYVMSI